ncbi:TIGR00730 family Rossman fold protein [Patescibacteria group bacterium]|nr:TIGR00730 family Rossman fold protein [Patescibacteria group bacterium]
MKPRIKQIVSRRDTSFSWRIFKIMGEFVTGFEFLQQYGLAATFFGTARCRKETKIYKEATKLAKELAKMGFAIITGGGPGIMEAANKGAVEAKGDSVGLNIQLPNEQRINPYVKESRAFHYFFTRKVMLSYASEVYIFFPGGFGTLDELYEILTLIQTRKICKIPVILVDKDFWQPLVEWMYGRLYRQDKAIDKEDLNLFKVVDNADEALKLIKKVIKSKKLVASETPIEYVAGEKIQK